MRNLISCKNLLATATATLLLAGCASNPAPIVNHSFGPGETSTTSTSGAASPAQSKTSSGGAQTFAVGGHANGTVTAAGYTVAPGDTLYSIAFANGLDFRALAARNNIPPPYTIHPGQMLKLTGGAPVAATTPASGTGHFTTVTTGTEPAQPTAPVFGPVTTQSMSANGVAPATAASTAAVATSAATPATAPAPPVATVVAPPAQPAVSAPATPPPSATRNVAGIAWRWPASGKVISGFEAGRGGDGAGVDIVGKVGDPVWAAASGTVVYSGNGLIGYGELIIIKHNDTYLSAYGHNSKRLVKEGQHVDAGQEIALMGASGAPRVELHFEIRKNGKPVDPTDFLPKR